MKKLSALIILCITFLTVNAQSTDTLKAAFNKDLHSMMQQYMKIESAMMEGNTLSAAASADTLNKIITAIDISPLNEEEQKIFLRESKKIITNTQHMVENSKNISHQQEYFSYISEEIYTLTKYFKNDETLYYDYCPMANNGDGGHWLTNKKEMNNPYLKGTIMGCEKQEEKF